MYKENELKNFENSILNMDCLDFMKNCPDKYFDLVLTDPPYELEIHGGGSMGAFCDRKLIKLKHLDFIAHGFDYDAIFNEFIRICKKVNIYLFCSNKQISKIMAWFENKGYLVTLLVWHKTNAVPLINKTYHSNAEFIVCVREQGATFNNLSVENSTKVFSLPFPTDKGRFHPTQKLISLIKKLIMRKSNENDIVLDCFSGSGTTALACCELNRKFVCIEKDRNYFNNSVKRLKNAQAQLKLNLL